MNRPLNDLFSTWNHLGLRWCLLRDDGVLSEEPPVADSRTSYSDVDILISPQDIDHACAIAFESGFLPLRAYGRGTHRFCVTYDRASDAWLELDLVTELSFGPYQELFISFAEPLLAGRIPMGDGWILSPSDRYWALLLHCLLDKKSIAPRHAAKLGATAPAEVGSLATLCLARWSRWSTEQVHQKAEAKDWAGLLRLGPSLAAAQRRAHPAATVRRYVTGRSLRAVERLLQARTRQGAAVAVVGPDGAGKSTLSEGIARHFYFPARIIYLGMWQNESAGTLLASVARIIQRPLKVWIRYLAGTRNRLLGRLVLFDRYTYDALIPPQPPWVQLKLPYFWVLAHLCPPPDIVLLLDAPGKVMFDRKGEFDAGHLDNERQHFLKLRSRMRNVHVLDATRPPAAVRADATAVIWSWYAERMQGDAMRSVPHRSGRG